MERKAHEARIEWKERPIVRVEATVMIRGELGFTPHLGYGNSRVAIYESVRKTAYLLYGYKIQDKKETLDFLIPLRMPFTRASPIFHHWVIDGTKMGLSFNGTADARAFDRGVRVALENLENASSINISSSSISDEPHSASPTSIQSFSLPYSEDNSSTENQLNVFAAANSRQPTELPHQFIANTLPKFRPQAFSTSSCKPLPASLSRAPRRHSSSVPGRPTRGSTSCSQPIAAVTSTRTADLSSSPAANCQSPPQSPLKSNCNAKDKKACTTPPLEIEHNRRLSGTSARRHRHRHDSHNHHHRSRRTKTPNLDNLERQRDSQPTKTNSYVQIASSGNPSVSSRNSVGLAGRGMGANENTLWSYNARSLTSRSSGNSLQDYRYHGLKTADEIKGKSLFNASPSFSSFSDPSAILKQSSLQKGKDHHKRGCGKYKEDLSERSRCQNCQAIFSHDENFPGSCPDAPTDSCEKCIENATCLCAARSVFYKCFPDTEGNYDRELCSCSSYHAGSRRRRWIILGILAIFLPCLCLYPVLKGCHRCGVACRCCGGRHEMIAPSRTSGGPPSS